MKTRALRSNPTTPSRVRAIALAALAVGLPTGCGREFYRQWANQDSSQAVFEKSRDPRWRLDLFSIEPPAMSRFADPYDQDTPPAPPDDFATQSLSPVPQWPSNRLLMPVEGTGYLDMLEAGPRYSSPPPRDLNPSATSAPAPYGGTTAPPPVPPVMPSPFSPGGNSGPGGGEMSPNPEPGPAPATPAPAEPTLPQAGSRTLDLGVRLAAFQATGLPMPVPPPGPSPEVPPGPRRDLNTPPIGMDPNPTNPDLSAPYPPPFGQTREQFRAAEAAGSEMAGLLVPGEIDFNEAEAGGLPRNSHPYVLTLEQSFNIALINSRTYQTSLESVYLAALNVTLQRFAFQPQFFAGLSPQTGVAGRGGLGGSFPPFVTGVNQFSYATRATGSPVSSLSLNEAAGFGKLFSSGGQILAGFANQLVFNFFGKHPIQPRVQSFLPLNIIQPFLRNGGRAVTLEPLTQAERNLVYQVRSFAKFRQEFIVANLVGGQIANFATTAQTNGFSGGGNLDPVVGFVNVVQDIQEIENDRKNLAAFEQLYKVYKELIQGESSGLTKLQLDQVDSNVQTARRNLVTDKLTYRNSLDQLKTQFGLPPDVPLILDRTLTRPFKDVFDAIDIWQRDPKRQMEDLPKFAARLPELQDVIVDGRSMLSVYKDYENNNEDALENILLAAERVALERRLDLMNARAALYDAWRQIRVTANALRGVLNVALTNTFVTQPATTNPFAFVDQAKQFSLVVNAELPLVRVNERNNFRAAILNYQRARRQLQFTEDFVKLQIRSDIRTLQANYLNYELSRRQFVLVIRQKDQAFEQIIAPPQGGGGAGGASSNNVGQVAQAATQTANLINFQNSLLTLENSLVRPWLSYVTSRLILFRDLGTLPYDEWEAYHELFPADTSGQPGPSGAAGAARSETAPTTEVVPG